MSKLQQLEQFSRWGLPTPRFRKLRYEDFVREPVEKFSRSLTFPLAVRSTYNGEDGDRSSMAGRFLTRLDVGPSELQLAVEMVFNSYPDREGQDVILQEMLSPDFSGVLFAFREGVWKVEYGPGRGEDLVSGRRRPQSILLPRFSRIDSWLAGVFAFWRGAPAPEMRRPLIQLSRHAAFLLEKSRAKTGLDIEFSVADGKLYLLQARPITTPEEAEQVLTSANHKEILPPRPSRLMTALISNSGKQLFDYYRRLDPSLPDYSFIREAAGMPWINLSALLEVMVHWGLPTRLVCESVGADDCYQVGFRPWRAFRKTLVFLKVLRQQWSSRRLVRRWLKEQQGRLDRQKRQREMLWREDPLRAFRLWETNFRALYVGLVTQMQMLTGAMSGPVQVLDRWGLLAKMAAQLKQKSTSTDYFLAFRDLQRGVLSRERFLEKFGHRGFYESDLGRPRFEEYEDADWRHLLKPGQSFPDSLRERKKEQATSFTLSRLLQPVIRLIHTRETLRHETMRFFRDFRRELNQHFRNVYGEAFNVWDYSPSELEDFLLGKSAPSASDGPARPQPSGWDIDTFLCNQEGRRLPLAYLDNVRDDSTDHTGIGIYPGRVTGRVWRVREAGLSGLNRPPFDSVILVADALDPGWIPFFSQVDGVISYTGGLLSHASIILRESQVPAITQLPAAFSLQTGDRIEMDGRSGKVRVVRR